MSPEKKAFAIAGFSIAVAAAGGYDTFVNIVPAREAIIREVGCSDLNLSYGDLINRRDSILKLSQLLGEPILNPSAERISECASDVSKVVDSRGLNPNYGLKPNLSVGTLILFGFVSGISGLVGIKIRQSRRIRIF